MSTKPVTKTKDIKIFMSKKPWDDVNVPPAELIPLQCETISASFSGTSTDEVEKTSLCSKAKEFIAGLTDSGTASYEMYYNLDNEGYQTIINSDESKKTHYFEVEYENKTKNIFLGFVSAREWGIEIGSLVKSTVTVRISGSMLNVTSDGKIITADGLIDPEAAPRAEEDSLPLASEDQSSDYLQI